MPAGSYPTEGVVQVILVMVLCLISEKTLCCRDFTSCLRHTSEHNAICDCYKSRCKFAFILYSTFLVEFKNQKSNL